MSFIYHIQSVAKYESKLLVRSWFFRIFMVLALVILGFFNFAMLVVENGGSFWMAKAVPSNIAYINLLLLNTGQAVIAVFLASDFLKRDKKLDTSEVFYVRPLSNAEYVIGKIWGNLRVFLLLNLMIMAIALLFNFIAQGTSVDWLAYPTYFLLISVPTLVFIIGLSIFLMLVLKNQALTFIILLGYIGLTLFYIQDKFYYLFDYMTYNLPLFKSSVVGFSNLELLINHRAIYFFAGLGFIFFTIFLFRRLPNASRSHYPWLVVSFCLFGASGAAGYKHVHDILHEADMRSLYTRINTKYVHTPKMLIDRYDLSVEQEADRFTAEASMTGVPLETASTFTFCLNPGLQVNEVRAGGKSLSFERDNQIVLVDFGKERMKGDTVTLSVSYGGRVDPAFCYLDIPAEVLQEPYQKDMVNIDKEYAFQTSDYILFTPETYWYPRPGTGYSDESPDWQQTYFSRFTLRVRPLAGLVPLSQGEGEEQGDGSYLFAPAYPFQSLTLVVGNYKEKHIVCDSVSYSVSYLDGHDYFSTALDSLQDTIPSMIRGMRENLERTYKLSYPFDRFSVVEVPAQFFSYSRAWSQAQETVQPEMVLFPEKGCTFQQLDLMKRQKEQMRWSHQGGREISVQEAQMRTLNNFLYLFVQTEGNYNYSSGGRGRYNISSQANPYFLFPQLYNFRYNIFSPEWPITNRVVELYLQRKSDNNGWEREVNGISNNEKANLLMEKHPFKELLADPKQRDLLDNIISLKGYCLFAPAEVNMGVNLFRDSLYAVLERNTFRNIRFETLLDTLGAISRTDILSGVAGWDQPTPLPAYTIGQPEVTKLTNKGKESFVLKIRLTNNSTTDGMLQVDIAGSGRGPDIDPRLNRKIPLAGGQSKLLVSVWDDAPGQVDVNTLISGNLPSVLNQPVTNIREERDREPEPEGDFIVPVASLSSEGEVIVDNEDSTLFVLSAPALVGLLPRLLDKVGDSSFKYGGFNPWWAPLQWTATTNAMYYGTYIRSACAIRSGDGSQTATWRIPVPAEGQYDLYYYVSKDNELRYNNHAEGEYSFRVRYGDETEDVFLNMKKAAEGWEQLGGYYFPADTVSVTLSNKCKLRSVTADAVKIVKR